MHSFIDELQKPVCCIHYFALHPQDWSLSRETMMLLEAAFLSRPAAGPHSYRHR